MEINYRKPSRTRECYKDIRAHMINQATLKGEMVPKEEFYHIATSYISEHWNGINIDIDDLYGAVSFWYENK